MTKELRPEAKYTLPLLIQYIKERLDDPTPLDYTCDIVNSSADRACLEVFPIHSDLRVLVRCEWTDYYANLTNANRVSGGFLDVENWIYLDHIERNLLRRAKLAKFLDHLHTLL